MRNDNNARRTRICIASPCYNEEAVIGIFCQELLAVIDRIPDVDFSVMLVDDGSDDNTLSLINSIAKGDPRVQVYSLSRNFGHQVALSAALDHARGDAIILMDSDLQHPPSLIVEFIGRWREGYDVVAGVRQQTADAGWMKRLSSDGFYTVFNFFSDVRITPGGADFCLLSRRACRAVSKMPERHRFLRGMIAWIGFSRYELPYVAPARAAGVSKYTIWRMIRLASDAVFSFSTKPLRLATKAGLLISFCGGLYLIYIISIRLFYHGATQGWASTISVIVILGGVQLVFVGLQGEYLARSLEQTKGRPLYLFKQTPPRRRGHREQPHAQ